MPKKPSGRSTPTANAALAAEWVDELVRDMGDKDRPIEVGSLARTLERWEHAPGGSGQLPRYLRMRGSNDEAKARSDDICAFVPSTDGGGVHLPHLHSGYSGNNSDISNPGHVSTRARYVINPSWYYGDCVLGGSGSDEEVICCRIRAPQPCVACPGGVSSRRLVPQFRRTPGAITLCEFGLSCRFRGCPDLALTRATPTPA